MAYSTINKGASYFNTILYTGNGSATQAITGVGFKPDLVWVKNRTAAVSHCWVDGVRAAPNQLGSDLTDAENTSGNAYGVYGGVSVLGTDGFTASLGSDPTYQATNKSAQNYCSWNWLAANSTTSNTSGSITATVSANTTSGFSVVSYTGNGSSGATVGHGLGVAPKMIIVKGRNTSLNWIVYHSGIGATKYIELNTTGAAQLQSSYNMFNSTAPTSSLFTLGNLSNTNGNTNTYIAYCFAEVKGYSKFGSYTGNNTNDGPFVYTGFKPAFILIKPYDGAYNWTIIDNKRNTYNVTTLGLIPNTASADTTGSGSTYNMDMLSNGFKPRYSSNELNGSLNYIYAAFAENPFVTSGGIPVTAR
jgi:hypothetical protein